MLRRKIEILPLNRREVKFTQTGERLSLRPEVSNFVNSQWDAKRKGWDNGLMPLITGIELGQQTADIRAGVMDYKITSGLLDAIKAGSPQVPSYVNNMSIGVIPVTSDGYVMVTRRNTNIHGGGVWNFNGGYMTSRLIDKPNCSDQRYATDPRLFNPRDQLNLRIHGQEFFGLKEEDLKPEPHPSALAIGLYHSLEPELGWPVKFKQDKRQMEAALRETDEHTRADFIPIEWIPALLKNQAGLLNKDPKTYESPKDPREIILLDDNIGELIGGAYEAISGSPIEPSIVEHLRKGGLQINIQDTSPGRVYKFPTSI